jgi:Uncharacterised nucleotidyltransferase
VKATKLQALLWLTSCLRGEMPPEIDWDAAIALANESMTTTNLAARVLDDRYRGDLPEDVRVFLTDVMVRNTSRNTRLLTQLEESVRTLNVVGIVPVLLKGAATIVTATSDVNAERMISDIDMFVSREEQAAAIQCLENIGYGVFDRSGGHDGPVTLARVSDVGMIDLHIKTRGPTALNADDKLHANCKIVTLNSAQCLVPSPTFQILHFVLHDQFHNRDYWKGHLDLRHLCDLAKIIRTFRDIDWDYLHTLFSHRSAADALASQLIQVKKLLGAAIPKELSGRLLARFQYRRVLAQMRFPYLRMTFICLTILSGWNHRNRDDVDYDVGLYRRFSGKARGIWRLFRADTLGKA